MMCVDDRVKDVSGQTKEEMAQNQSRGFDRAAVLYVTYCRL